MLRIERNYRILRPREDLNELTKAVVDLFTLFFSRLLMLQKSISAFHLKCQLVKWPRRWFLIPSWLLVTCRNTMRSLRMKPQVIWEALASLRSYEGNCEENVTLKLNFELSLLRLFCVDHVVKNRRSALSLAWHEWLRARVVLRTSNMKISRRRLADCVKTLHQKACRTCSTIIFLYSTNQIIDLWRCRWRCRR